MRGEFVALWAGDSMWIDIEAFRATSERARVTGDLNTYEEALALYRGDLLPEDRYEDWAIRWRDSLRAVRFDLLLDVATLHEQRGDLEQAIRALRQVVESDPGHEEAQMHLMRLLTASGHRQAAVRQYRQLHDTLLEELHVEPSAATKQLYEQILTAEPAPVNPAQFGSPFAVHVGPRHDAVIGRDVELARLDRQIELLFNGQGSLVVVTGDAGIGKSRLVTEALDRSAHQGAITLWGAAYRSRQEQPYSMFSILLDGFALRVPPENLHALLGSSRDVLAALAPGLARALNLGDHESDLRPPGQSLVASAMLDLFSQLTRFAPVALILDDVHFADAASLQLLERLSDVLLDLPVLALVTCCDTEIAPASEVGKFLKKLQEGNRAAILPLQELGIDETRWLTTRVLEGEVDAPVVETIYRLAAGNPHYTVEAARALRGRKRIVQQLGKWRLRSGVAVTWRREHLRARPSSGDFRVTRLLRV
jgi:tetratricopeptide (TPR) repeat protein